MNYLAGVLRILSYLFVFPGGTLIGTEHTSDAKFPLIIGIALGFAAYGMRAEHEDTKNEDASTINVRMVAEPKHHPKCMRSYSNDPKAPCYCPTGWPQRTRQKNGRDKE